MNQTHQTKYLDYNGLKYLWSKINGKVDEIGGYEILNLTLTANTGGGGSLQLLP